MDNPGLEDRMSQRQGRGVVTQLSDSSYLVTEIP
jgi:hypothetical protein